MTTYGYVVVMLAVNLSLERKILANYLVSAVAASIIIPSVIVSYA